MVLTGIPINLQFKLNVFFARNRHTVSVSEIPVVVSFPHCVNRSSTL